MRNYPSFNDEPKANLNWLETIVVSLTVTRKLIIYADFILNLKNFLFITKFIFIFFFADSIMEKSFG